MKAEFFSPHIRALISDEAYLIEQETYDISKNLQYESVFAMANGYMGVRGAFEEGSHIELPCTFINGVFDKSETFMRELANLPNWLPTKLYVNKELLGVDRSEILSFSRVLDMKKSVLYRHMVVKDRWGNETRIETMRFLSRSNVHFGAIKMFVTALNYDGILECESIIDASVLNFADAPRFKVKHTELVENADASDGIYVEVKTRDFGQHVGIGTRVLLCDASGNNIRKNRMYSRFGEQAVEFCDCDLKQNETIEIHKIMSIYAERDFDGKYSKPIKHAVLTGMEHLDHTTIDTELEQHTSVYAKMWDMADIDIGNDFELNRVIRFNIYQLMSTGSEHDSHVNVGAKLLHGEEYGGHAFWDTELFMLPFFTHVFPETARNLVSYRYFLLDAARRNAADNGYKGAKYPWESADTGDEECPDWTIMPDGSCYRCYVAQYEHHITAAVAVGLYKYFKATGDIGFMLDKGAEIILETARFWSTRFEYNEAKQHYEITQVTGPDEWHEPVNNNCYTNYLAMYSIELGFEIIDLLKATYPERYAELVAKLTITDEELSFWRHVHDHVYLPMAKDGKLFEQFEGYFTDYLDVVIEKYNENDMPVRPAILKEMSVRKTTLIKQADVVMLMYLLGDRFDSETQRVNYDYYEKRTLHGSSLSPSIYSIMGLRVGRTDMAYKYLRRAAYIDLNDLQHNTREGIHAANAGGVWKVLVFGFGGVSINHNSMLCIDPSLPEKWDHITFKLWFNGRLMKINITSGEKDRNNVDVELLSGEPLTILINNAERVIR